MSGKKNKKAGKEAGKKESERKSSSQGGDSSPDNRDYTDFDPTTYVRRGEHGGLEVVTWWKEVTPGGDEKEDNASQADEEWDNMIANLTRLYDDENVWKDSRPKAVSLFIVKDASFHPFSKAAKRFFDMVCSQEQPTAVFLWTKSSRHVLLHICDVEDSPPVMVYDYDDTSATWHENTYEKAVARYPPDWSMLFNPSSRLSFKRVLWFGLLCAEYARDERALQDWLHMSLLTSSLAPATPAKLGQFILKTFPMLQKAPKIAQWRNRLAQEARNRIQLVKHFLDNQ